MESYSKHQGCPITNAWNSMLVITNRKGCPALHGHITLTDLGHSMCPSPLLCCLDRSRFIVLPPLSNVIGERVVGIRGSKQCLNRE